MDRLATIYYRPKDMPGLEGLRAKASQHKFPRHAHPELVVGLVTAGAKQFKIQGRDLLVGAGSIFIIRPGQVHTSYALSENGTSYIAWFISVQHFAESEMTAATQSPPARQTSIGRGAYKEILALQRAVEEGASLLVRDSCLQELIARVTLSNLDLLPVPSRIAAPGVSRAAQYLHECYSQPIQLADLADCAGVSRFHFLRLFQDVYQLPPHAYQDAIRVQRAKDLLLNGEPLADVAQAVGYSDQAHLTRRMKRLTALTPGQIAKAQQ